MRSRTFNFNLRLPPACLLFYRTQNIKDSSGLRLGLPDEKGRLEILKIHTDRMKQSGMMHKDVDLKEIAGLTKNFSGAELAGLVGAAQSCAFVRHTKVGSFFGFSRTLFECVCLK